MLHAEHREVRVIGGDKKKGFSPKRSLWSAEATRTIMRFYFHWIFPLEWNVVLRLAQVIGVAPHLKVQQSPVRKDAPGGRDGSGMRRNQFYDRNKRSRAVALSFIDERAC